MIFKNEELTEFYKSLNEKGKTELFRNWNGDNVFLVRHDVDFDIKLAHDMAKIEHNAGIVSTYFILTTCHTYNVLSERNRTLLKEIFEMNHEIALHFDPTLYSSNLQENAEKEAQILSYACGEEVKSVSLHNPSVHGQYPLFEGFVNAYDPSMFSDENYISDSCFSFRGKNPFNFIDNIKDSMVQILLHPMHYSEKGWGYGDVLIETFKEYMNDVHEGFLINATYKEQVGPDFIKLLKEKL